MIRAPPAPSRRAAKLLVAGCLLLGAGFLIKLDATGMIATNVISGVSRAAAPVMQYAAPVLPGGRVGSGNWYDQQREQYGMERYGSRYGVGGYGGFRRGPSLATAPGVEVQGEELRTWAYEDPFVESVQVDLTSAKMGCPLSATVEVWNGAGNTPMQIRTYSEDGELRPFSAVVETPRSPSTVAVRNIGQVEFPLVAQVDEEFVERPNLPEHQRVVEMIQGGAVQTFPMDPVVEAVEVLLETDGRPLNARIEILQGPGSIKQVVELYSEDGTEQPFFCTLATPWQGGDGTTVRVVNTGPVEFPMTASIVPTAPRETTLQSLYQ